MEYLGGENRKQRRGTAEQYREQVEKLRAEQLRLLHQETNPDREILSNRALGDDCRQPRVGDLSEEEHRNRTQNSFDGVGEPGAGKTVENTTGRRTNYRRELPERRAPGDGVGVGVTRYDLRTQGGPRRLQEAAREPTDGNDDVDGQHRSHQKAAVISGEDEQGRSAHKLNYERDDRENLPVVAIRDMTRV